MELWRDIVEFDGKYQISNYGRVKNTTTGNVLKSRRDSFGYQRINLYYSGKRIMRYIHRLVAEAFIPNPDKQTTVNHMDENKQNNCADNLEWCSNYYNLTYGSAPRKAAEGRSKPVVQMSLSGEPIATFPSAAEAYRMIGINQYHIGACCRKVQQTTHGYIWEFAE